MKVKSHLLGCFAIGVLTLYSAEAQGTGYWHTSGSQILDSSGRAVRIAGINWYGFETTTGVVHGLSSQDYKSILNTIHANGYNTIRVPFSNQMVEGGISPQNISFNNGSGAINTDLRGLSSLQVLDKIVAYAGTLGVRIILDNHRSEAGDSAEANGLWYTNTYPESAWIADWQALATRYQGNSTVIGADLRNEPHNANSGGSCWGCGSTTNDWRLAAQRGGNAVLAINPKWLIFVEGTDGYNNDFDWWGGNLEGAQSYPVVLNVPNQLVYSAHDYGPDLYGQSWFNSSTTYSSLAAVWTKFWAYLSINNIAPVWVGEFGTTNNAADLASSTPGSQGQWFQSMVQFLKTNPNLSWTYWALNGEDEFALLDSNYDSAPVSAQKQQALTSIQFPLGAGNIPCTATPATPSGLSATAVSSTQISLSWAAVTPASGCSVSYDVYASTTAGFIPSPSTLVASGLSSAAYTDAGLAAKTAYYFAVSALDAAGQSAPSADQSATTAASTPQPPVAPTNLSAVAASSTTINLTWGASSTSGVTYNVYRNTSSSATVSNSTRIATGITATSYASSGMTAATTYYYLVTAANGNGESAPANLASATTQAGTQSGSSCHVVYTLNSLWNVGFSAGVTIQNTATAPINNWTLSWTWPANESIQQAWNSNLVSGGPNVTLTNASWNGSIAPGATISGVGFNGSYSGTYVAPTTFYLNGSLCK